MPSHFVYYIEGKSAISVETMAETLRGTGLDRVLPSDSIRYRTTSAGPFGGGPGITFACLPANIRGDDFKARLGYKPAEQEWVQGRGFSVGYWKDARPSVKELARPENVAGFFVELEGDEFLVPVARLADGGTLLPNRLGRDKNGALVKTPIERYAALCGYAQEMFELISKAYENNQDTLDLSHDRQLEITEEAIGINYHIGPAELTLLGCVTEQNVMNVPAMITDLPGVMEMMRAKKAGAEGNECALIGDGSDTECGAQADSPTTTQQ